MYLSSWITLFASSLSLVFLVSAGIILLFPSYELSENSSNELSSNGTNTYGLMKPDCLKFQLMGSFSWSRFHKHDGRFFDSKYFRESHPVITFLFPEILDHPFSPRFCTPDTRTCVYQKVRNVSFPENFAYVTLCLNIYDESSLEQWNKNTGTKTSLDYISKSYILVMKKN